MINKPVICKQIQLISVQNQQISIMNQQICKNKYIDSLLLFLIYL